MIPVYIIQSNYSLCENTCIEFVTINKYKAYKYFDKIFEDEFTSYELQEWQGKDYKTLKRK